MEQLLADQALLHLVIRTIKYIAKPDLSLVEVINRLAVTGVTLNTLKLF